MTGPITTNKRHRAAVLEAHRRDLAQWGARRSEVFRRPGPHLRPGRDPFNQPREIRK